MAQLKMIPTLTQLASVFGGPPMYYHASYDVLGASGDYRCATPVAESAEQWISCGSSTPDEYFGSPIDEAIVPLGYIGSIVARNVEQPEGWPTPEPFVSYRIDPDFLAARSLLTTWIDSPLAWQVLAATLHPASFRLRLDWPSGTGESDYDFFSRVTAKFPVASGAETWQAIAYRLAWQQQWVVPDVSDSRYYINDQSFFVWHFRALVLSDYFSQPAMQAVYGNVNWPVIAGIDQNVLNTEKNLASQNKIASAKNDADIGVMGYVTLAVMSFGIGTAVAAAIAAAAASAAAAATAEAAASVSATTAAATTGETLAAAFGNVATNVATKVATQQIMSLAVSGGLSDLDPTKLALSAAGQFLSTADIADLKDLDASFPNVDVTDVVPMVQAGWGIVDAYNAINADPTLPQRPVPPPPKTGAAPVVVTEPVPMLTPSMTEFVPAGETVSAQAVTTVDGPLSVATSQETGVNWALWITLVTALLGHK